MAILSNNVKVSLATVDICEQNLLSRNSLATVQSYDYNLVKIINPYGTVSDNAGGSVFKFTIRVGTKDNLTVYYERLQQTFQTAFSLLFNPIFDDSGNLVSYGGALIIRGYVVDLEEIYDRQLADTQGEQMSLSVNVLIKKIIYIGENNNLSYEF